jgi:hypothetical protein
VLIGALGAALSTSGAALDVFSSSAVSAESLAPLPSVGLDDSARAGDEGVAEPGVVPVNVPGFAAPDGGAERPAAPSMVRHSRKLGQPETSHVRTDPTLPDPTLPDPTLPDPALPDPTLPDPTLPDSRPAPTHPSPSTEGPALRDGLTTDNPFE